MAYSRFFAFKIGSAFTWLSKMIIIWRELWQLDQHFKIPRCACVFVHVRMCIFVYVFVCLCVDMCPCMNACICVNMRLSVCEHSYIIYFVL